MQATHRRMAWAALGLLVCTANAMAAEAPVFRSHPPARPLAAPSRRAMDQGPAYFVDAARGDDRNDGSEAKPWQTLAKAVRQLKPGDTLCLRGGTYHENVTVTCSGTETKPVTIRAYRGEVAIIDGGLREFQDSPATAWEPCPDGVKGEFRSVKTYPDLGGSRGGCNVLGSFADSMIPLQGYRFLKDLRDPSMVWDVKEKVGDEEGVYCGPGIWYDVETGRLHARLAPTTVKALAADNYRGANDPRKLPLVIAGLKSGPALAVRGARHLRLQDLVVRGARTATLEIADVADITLDGLTVYGGGTAIGVHGTTGLRVYHTAARGVAAPWTFRGHLKYRSTEARLFSASGWSPTMRLNRDFDIACSEFTDSVDGVFIGNVKNVHFHHNLLDNVSDDGIFLTATTAPDGTTIGGDVFIYQNVLARCLTTFAFGVGHGRQRITTTGKQTGSGVHIFRNVFDYRRPVMYHFPPDPAGAEELPSKGRFASDHGGPAWEPMNIYHNTIVADDEAADKYGTAGLGDHTGGGAARRVFNNIVAQVNGMPGYLLPPTTSNLHADRNLFWSAVRGPAFQGDLFAKFRQAKEFEASKKQYAPGWGASDRFADPRFTRFDADWKAALDLSLEASSPAIDAGLPLPAEWPDPIRAEDKGKPDLGVLPAGGQPWRVGIRGRLTMFGAETTSTALPPLVPMTFPERPPRVVAAGKPAVIVQGYPARDVPLVEFALGRQGVTVETLQRAWLPTKEYGKYGMVVITGGLVRAQIQPNKYSPEDLKLVQQYLEQGGTLLLMRGNTDVFATTPGRSFLADLVGTAPAEEDVKLEVLQPKHAWVKHLDPKRATQKIAIPPDPLKKKAANVDLLDDLKPGKKPTDATVTVGISYLDARRNMPLRANKGDRIIGTPKGTTTLYRLRAGKGQLVYIGWEIADSLPDGRGKSTVEQELLFEDQMHILFNIVADVYPRNLTPE